MSENLLNQFQQQNSNALSSLNSHLDTSPTLNVTSSIPSYIPLSTSVYNGNNNTISYNYINSSLTGSQGQKLIYQSPFTNLNATNCYQQSGNHPYPADYNLSQNCQDIQMPTTTASAYLADSSENNITRSYDPKVVEEIIAKSKQNLIQNQKKMQEQVLIQQGIYSNQTTTISLNETQKSPSNPLYTKNLSPLKKHLPNTSKPQDNNERHKIITQLKSMSQLKEELMQNQQMYQSELSTLMTNMKQDIQHEIKQNIHNGNSSQENNESLRQSQQKYSTLLSEHSFIQQLYQSEKDHVYKMTEQHSQQINELKNTISLQQTHLSTMQKEFTIEKIRLAEELQIQKDSLIAERTFHEALLSEKEDIIQHTNNQIESEKRVQSRQINQLREEISNLSHNNKDDIISQQQHALNLLSTKLHNSNNLSLLDMSTPQQIIENDEMNVEITFQTNQISSRQEQDKQGYSNSAETFKHSLTEGKLCIDLLNSEIATLTNQVISLNETSLQDKERHAETVNRCENRELELIQKLEQFQSLLTQSATTCKEQTRQLDETSKTVIELNTILEQHEHTIKKDTEILSQYQEQIVQLSNQHNSHLQDSLSEQKKIHSDLVTSNEHRIRQCQDNHTFQISTLKQQHLSALLDQATQLNLSTQAHLQSNEIAVKQKTESEAKRYEQQLEDQALSFKAKMNEHEQNWIKKLDLINFDNDSLAKSSLQKVSFTEKEVSELNVKMQALQNEHQKELIQQEERCQHLITTAFASQTRVITPSSPYTTSAFDRTVPLTHNTVLVNEDYVLRSEYSVLQNSLRELMDVNKENMKKVQEERRLYGILKEECNKLEQQLLLKNNQPLNDSANSLLQFTQKSTNNPSSLINTKNGLKRQDSSALQEVDLRRKKQLEVDLLQLKEENAVIRSQLKDKYEGEIAFLKSEGVEQEQKLKELGKVKAELQVLKEEKEECEWSEARKSHAIKATLESNSTNRTNGKEEMVKIIEQKNEELRKIKVALKQSQNSLAKLESTQISLVESSHQSTKKPVEQSQKQLTQLNNKGIDSELQKILQLSEIIHLLNKN